MSRWIPIRGAHPRSRAAWFVMALELILGVGALGGGAALVLGPRGQVIPLPVAALRGSPFDTYLVPGLILFFVLGVGPLVAVGLSWQHDRWSPVLAIVTGAALLGWMIVEIAIVGYTSSPPLQGIYLGIATALLFVGIESHWSRARRTRALLRKRLFRAPAGS